MQFYLLGYPLGHSMSPFLHQAFLSQAKLEGHYELKEISPKTFSEEVTRLKEMGCDGFNITIPYKVDILPFLDRVDSEAEAIGAVNTVVVEDDKWIGYNTDGRGYVTSLKYHFPALFTAESRFLVLGAGGASRGIVHALNNEICDAITVCNRTVEKADALLESLSGSKQLAGISYEEAEKTLDMYDCIINTTSVGMEPHTRNQAISLKHLSKDTVVSDIVYKPFHTTLLQDAKKRGAQIHHGHEMLVYQAALAFKLWTGFTVDVRPVIQAFEEKLIK